MCEKAELIAKDIMDYIAEQLKYCHIKKELWHTYQVPYGVCHTYDIDELFSELKIEDIIRKYI